jgi:sugar/nucleoside kinase (ribokinase family)
VTGILSFQERITQLKLISMGEILWDVLPSSQHLGGAPFNFAFHAHRLEHEICFVSAIGNDLLGASAIRQMEQAGLSTRFLRVTPEHPTGTVTVAFDGAGIPTYKIHRPAPMTSLFCSRKISVLWSIQRRTGSTLELCSR